MLQHVPLETAAVLVDVLVGIAYKMECAARALLNKPDDLVLRLVQVLGFIDEQHFYVAVPIALREHFLLN